MMSARPGVVFPTPPRRAGERPCERDSRPPPPHPHAKSQGRIDSGTGSRQPPAMPKSSKTEFDVIVWGATGFTGCLVAEYLARTPETHPPPLAIPRQDPPNTHTT